MAPVIIAHDGPITTLTLNRPDKRNALSIDLLEALCSAVESSEQDTTRRLLVLRGAGTVFSSGLDLGEAAQPEYAQRSASLVQRALGIISGTRLVTIAVVQGAAIAGGAGLATACDFVLATRAAKFGYPEIRRGLVPALIMTFLRRQLRERDARELLLLGKLFDATHAHAIGLINRVADDEAALEVELRSITSSLLQGAPNALSETKHLLASLWPVAITKDLTAAHEYHLSARNSAEAQEGIAAFHEKRAPRWAG